MIFHNMALCLNALFVTIGVARTRISRRMSYDLASLFAKLVANCAHVEDNVDFCYLRALSLRANGNTLTRRNLGKVVAAIANEDTERRDHVVIAKKIY